MAQVKPTDWVGWVYFASMLMLVLGGLQAMAGLVALLKDEYYFVSESGMLVLDYTAWGWINLLMGFLIVSAGAALGSGKMWGRVVGCLLVVLNAIGNLAFWSAYPVWNTIALVLDVVVLYALTVHGREAALE